MTSMMESGSRISDAGWPDAGSCGTVTVRSSRSEVRAPQLLISSRS